MLWWCVIANGTGKLAFIDAILDKHTFLNILKNNIEESATKFGLLENVYFQQDNDRKHTTAIM